MKYKIFNVYAIIVYYTTEIAKKKKAKKIYLFKY